jgi:ATPases involved in chromosome partitioning
MSTMVVNVLTDLNIAGILIGYINDTVLATDIVKRFEEADKLDTKVFSSKVITNVTVPESQTIHQSLFEYASKSKATQGYLDFAEELLGE